jgi:hypothetical protein
MNNLEMIIAGVLVIGLAAKLCKHCFWFMGNA